MEERIEELVKKFNSTRIEELVKEYSNPKNNPDLRRIKYAIHNETWENRMECET